MSDTKNAERKNWTTKDWMSHVGAWETDRDTIEFGSVMAVGAMLIQFQQFVLWQVSQQPTQNAIEIGEVRHFAQSFPYLEPAHIKVLFTGDPPKNGTKVYVMPPAPEATKNE